MSAVLALGASSRQGPGQSRANKIWVWKTQVDQLQQRDWTGATDALDGTRTTSRSSPDEGRCVEDVPVRPGSGTIETGRYAPSARCRGLRRSRARRTDARAPRRTESRMKPDTAPATTSWDRAWTISKKFTQGLCRDPPTGHRAAATNCASGMHQPVATGRATAGVPDWGRTQF